MNNNFLLLENEEIILDTKSICKLHFDSKKRNYFDDFF